ncbi:hypothetical protein AAK899_11185 [Erysipelotrichaceae bacterium 51-3]
MVIRGSENPVHIKDNFNIWDFELTKEEMDQIAALNQNKRYYHSALELPEKYVAMVPDVEDQK